MINFQFVLKKKQFKNKDKIKTQTQQRLKTKKWCHHKIMFNKITRGANIAKIKNKEMVPSQDYVLQDNKRCYDKIFSDWNFRPPSNVFWQA